MDSLQHWTGCYFDLDAVSKYLDGWRDARPPFPKRASELMVTWAFAKFLQSANKKTYSVGFPCLKEVEKAELSSFVTGDLAADSLEFDTLVANKDDALNDYHKIQVKRYIADGKLDTRSLFEYIKDKVRRYGEDTKLNIIIWVQAQVRLDVALFASLVTAEEFPIGSIWIFFQPRRGSERPPAFWQVHPTDGNQAIWIKSSVPSDTDEHSE